MSRKSDFLARFSDVDDLSEVDRMRLDLAADMYELADGLERASQTVAAIDLARKLLGEIAWPGAGSAASKAAADLARRKHQARKSHMALVES